VTTTEETTTRTRTTPPATPTAILVILAAKLPAASPEQQRTLLGEALYSLVDQLDPARRGLYTLNQVQTPSLKAAYL
jgi:hypothetical protein